MELDVYMLGYIGCLFNLLKHNQCKKHITQQIFISTQHKLHIE